MVHLSLYLKCFIFLVIPCFQILADEVDFKRERQEMVKVQIEERGIIDSATRQAMREVPRHLFVPDDLVSMAYEDGPLPIGYGQTISQPYIVAFMTEIVNPKPDDKVLEIGTGSGYQAAVLGEMVSEVFTIEIVFDLAKSARQRLSDLNYRNIKVRHGDGYFGWPEEAPFDCIIITAAADHIPPPLIDQLKDGGKMIIPVGHPFFLQNLVLVEKVGDEISTRKILPVAFVPFRRDIR